MFLIFVSFLMLLLVLDWIFWNLVKLDLMCLNILNVNLWLVLYFENFDVGLFLKLLWFNFSWLCFDWRFCICFLRDVIVLFFELRVFFNLVMCWVSDCIIIFILIRLILDCFVVLFLLKMYLILFFLFWVNMYNIK